jgi:hypothetical protein
MRKELENRLEAGLHAPAETSDEKLVEIELEYWTECALEMGGLIRRAA